VDDRTVVIREHLELDVPRRLDELLDVHRAGPEGRLRLALAVRSSEPSSPGLRTMRMPRPPPRPRP